MTLKQKFAVAVGGACFAVAAGGAAFSVYSLADEFAHRASPVQTQAAAGCKQDLANGGTCSEFGREALDLVRKNHDELIIGFDVCIASFALTHVAKKLLTPARYT